MRRSWLPVLLALLAALLILWSAHARRWWSMESSLVSVRIGLSTVEACFDDGNSRRCHVQRFRDVGIERQRQRWFLASAGVTYVVALGASAAVVIAALLARLRGGGRALARVAMLGCAVAAMGGLLVVMLRPDWGAEMPVRLGLGLPALLVGSALGAWGAVLTTRATPADGALAAAAQARVRAPAPAPGDDAPAAAGDGAAPDAPLVAPPGPRPRAPRMLDLRVRPRLPTNPLLYGPPCARCSAPTRWSAAQRWVCDRCHIDPA
ncbi:MAG: hypothetical protein IT370_29330 [Deltaproteobacteria bacterium]|nr:hypothetical protein [Deltaproteobacteria bacterium]